MDQGPPTLQPALASRSRSEGFPPSTTFGAFVTPASSFATSSTGLSDDTKGTLGLITLHEPTPPIYPVADIIFIHGLGGGSRKTWSFSSDLGQFWPQAWLSVDSDFRDARIHTFGYKADWDERKQSILDIHGFGQTLLAALCNHPTIRRSNTRIILVGHSMGGCVAKKAYILANQDPTASDLCRRIHSMFFLGTPHRGSDMAALLDNIMSATLGSWGKKRFVSDLAPNSAALVSINDSFRHVAPALRLWSFYETLPVRQGLMSRLVVDQYSATLQYHNEQIVPMNADHRQVCKFSSPADPNYQILRNALVTAVDLVRSICVSFSATSGMTAAQEKARLSLRSFLGVQSSPEGDLETLQLLRQPDTCQWLAHKDFFASWMSGTAQNHILWLTGRPGIGKSVLASFVIEQLQSSGKHCSYFIFKNTEAGGSMLIECLRSLAWQMSIHDALVRDALLNVMESEPLWDKSDEASFWRHVFSSCIFRLPSISQHFWVIDGIDECANFEVLFTKRFLSTVPPEVRLFATSRPLQKIARGLATLGSKVLSHSLSDTDTTEDIRLFLSARLIDLDLLDSESDRERMCNKILAKARGSFLWVRLVLHDLEESFSEEAMEAVLQDVPADLSDLYARLAKMIMADVQKATIARTIFKWTALCSRPLTVDELRFAIKLDVGQTVHNPAKAIPEVCAHLVYVDQDNKVQLIHDTVRDFLVSNDAESPPILQKQADHTSIARILLKLLQQPRRITSFASLTARTQVSDLLLGTLLNYACRFFSMHVWKATSKDDPLMLDIASFFRGPSVLHWIEHIAESGDLSTVARSALHLRDYLKRRSKYVPPTDTFVQEVGNWVHDLVRIIAKFRPQLLSSPQSIHYFTPQLCPEDSMIWQSFHKMSSGHAVVRGYKSYVWEECLARIDFQDGLATAVSHGEHFFAIGLSNGHLSLHDSETAQCVRIMNHPERVNQLVFSANDVYLASCGMKKLLIWDPASGAMIYSFPLQTPPLAISFSGNEYLFCALKSGAVNRWSFHDDKLAPPQTFHTVTRPGEDLVTQFKARPPPTAAAFCHLENDTLLALGYSVQPAAIWSQLGVTHFEPRLLGDCHTDEKNPGTGGTNKMCFNPHPELPALILSYRDGSICIFNYRTRRQSCRVGQVNASHLACSPSGRTLVASTGSGAIKAFEFDSSEGEFTLQSVYRTNDPLDDPIRGVTISPDGLRFADVRARQCRVWAPAVLVKMALVPNDEVRSTNASVATNSAFSYLSAERFNGESPHATSRATAGRAITSPLVCDDSGSWIIAGTNHAEVVLFSTTTPTASKILYQHKAGTEIISVAMDGSGATIVSLDSYGRVLVTKSAEPLSNLSDIASVKTLNVVCDVVFKEWAVRQVLLNPGAAEVLVSGAHWHKLLSIATGTITIANGAADIGQVTNLEMNVIVKPSDQPHNPTKEPEGSFKPHSIAFQHPGSSDRFIIVTGNIARVYSWTDFTELTATGGIQLDRTRVATTSSNQRHHKPSYHVGSNFVLELLQGSPGSKAEFYVWPTSTFDQPQAEGSRPARPSHVPDLGAISRNVLHVLGFIDGTKMLFLDVNLWVCSITLGSLFTESSPQPSPQPVPSHVPLIIKPQAERYFFALSEWRAEFGKLESLSWVTAKTRNGKAAGISVAFANGEGVVVVSWDLQYSETVEVVDGHQQTDTRAAANGKKIAWHDPWKVVALNGFDGSFGWGFGEPVK